VTDNAVRRRRPSARLAGSGAALVLLACAAGPSPERADPLALGAGAPAAALVDVRDTTTDLAALVARAGDSTRIVLRPGRFRIHAPGILIERKHELTIEGAGAGRTIVALDSTVDLGFDIRDSVVGFTLERLTIAPLGASRARTQAFGSNTGRHGIRRIAVRDIEVKDVGLGISIGAGVTGEYDTVVVERNRLTNLVGTTPGAGYGIHNDNASHVRIVENEIRGAQRHSYYQARGSADIRFERNLIVNHGRGARNSNPDVAALAIARSSDVVVIGNVIINPYTTPISVEYDDVLGRPVNGIAIIGNVIVGARFADVWLNANGRYLSCRNRYVHWPDATLDTLRRGAEGQRGSLSPDAAARVSCPPGPAEPGIDREAVEHPASDPPRPASLPLRIVVAEALGRQYVFVGPCLHELARPSGADVVLDCARP
jgi:hypothetical protein